MNRNTKTFLLILTIIPIVYMAYFSFRIYSSVYTGEPLFSDGFPKLLFALHMVSAVINIGLFIFYIVHIIRNNNLSRGSKATWMITSFLFSNFTFIAYWFIHLWNAPEEYIPPDGSSWRGPSFS